MICTQWWNGVWCASNDGLAHRGWYAPLATPTELLLLADISTMYQPPLPHHGHLTSHEHHSSLTQGEREPPKLLKHNKYELPHFEEGWGGALGCGLHIKKGPNFPYTIWRGGRSLGHG